MTWTRKGLPKPALAIVTVAMALTLALRAPNAAEPDAGAPRQATLPLSVVILYTSGVGYFQRDGQVDGNTQVELKFKTEDINDLLKSLVVQDFGGGQIAAVTYGSRDPIARTLKSFGIDLTDEPGFGGLLKQVRGERVEVTTPNAVTGTVLGVETKRKPVGGGQEPEKIVEVEYLNLLTDDGLRSIPLEQVQQVKLLNPKLDTELRQALEVLAAGHDTEKKTVVLKLDGQGPRKVSLSYIAATPVWKTSYRLVLDEKEKPFLQGWAIVENTTDDDWNNVQLALVSGRPISFAMDLYEPLYVNRPVVVPELFASLRPRLYGQAMEKQGADDIQFATDANSPAPEPGAAPVPPMAQGMMGGMGGMGMARAAAPMVARRKMNLQKGVSPSAEGAATGELFQYAIKSPVTLARQKSAMLPIISQPVEGQKLSIYNQQVQARHPLNGFRLKNATPLYLMQGPITVFDADAYAGDARIDDLAPGQDRLISYALDLKVEVEPQDNGGRQEIVAVKIERGTLIVTRKNTEAKALRGPQPRHQEEGRPDRAPLPRRLDPDRADRAGRADPRRVPVQRSRRPRQGRQASGARGPPARRDGRDRQHRIGADRSSTFGCETSANESRTPCARPRTLRDQLENTRGDRTRLEQRIGEIDQEQSRIRENMSKLAANSELANRYIKKLDQQETEIDDVRRQIATLKDDRGPSAARAERLPDGARPGLTEGSPRQGWS